MNKIVFLIPIFVLLCSCSEDIVEDEGQPLITLEPSVELYLNYGASNSEEFVFDLLINANPKSYGGNIVGDLAYSYRVWETAYNCTKKESLVSNHIVSPDGELEHRSATESPTMMYELKHSKSNIATNDLLDFNISGEIVVSNGSASDTTFYTYLFEKEIQMVAP